MMEASGESVGKPDPDGTGAPVHAHWNFDRGATWGSILSACRRAGIALSINETNERKKTHICSKGPTSRCDDEEVDHVDRDALPDLSRFQEEIFGISSSCPGGAVDLDAIDPETILERIEGRTSKFHDGTIAIKTMITDRMKKHILEGLRHLGVTKDDSQAAADGRRRVWNSEAASAVFGLVSILFCLEQLGVRSASYSPLPVPSGATGNVTKSNDSDKTTARSIQVPSMAGMNVILVSGADTPIYDACSIALLKLRLSEAHHRVSGANTPAITLLGQYVGMDETNSSIGSDVGVTLTLGTLLPEERPVGREDPFHCKGLRPLLTNTTETLPPTTELPWKTDRVVLLETNVDDTTAEHLQFVLELIMEHPGALDAWTSPIGMKKGRSAAATVLAVLCTEDSQDDLVLLLFRHSTTLGVRRRTVDRATLRRRVLTVETDWTCRRVGTTALSHGRVSVKVAYLLIFDHDSQKSEEEIVSIKPEFDHCREIALATGISIQSITDQALQLAKQKLATSSGS
jgi:hypothetical protein